MSSEDFSLDRFSAVFSVRSPKEKVGSYSEVFKISYISLARVLEKTVRVIEFLNSFGKSSGAVREKSCKDYSSLINSGSSIAELAFDVEELEKAILENIEKINEFLRFLSESNQVLEAEIKNLRNSGPHNAYEKIESLFIENEKISRDNFYLSEELRLVKSSFENELENARSQWAQSLDGIRATYEFNIKEIRESHEHEIKKIKESFKEKNSAQKKNSNETEKKLVEKLDKMTVDQSEILNKLNDKILFLSAKINENELFIEGLCDKIEDLFEKYEIDKSSSSGQNAKDKISSRVNDLETLFSSNKEVFRKLRKYNPGQAAKFLQQKLVENSFVLKEFEDARSKLMKHFSCERTKSQEFKVPQTSRF